MMVCEKNFSSVFDYSSAFNYESIVPISKSVNNQFYRSAFSYHSGNVSRINDCDEVGQRSWIYTFATKGIVIFFHVLAIIFFPLSMWICLKKINSLERIVLMRLGKLQPIRGPGFTFVLPVIDSWTKIDLQPQTFTITTSQLLTADGAIIEAKSDFQYQICDIVSYVTKLKKQEKTLKELGLFCLKNIISEKDEEDLKNNREFISCTLKEELNRSVVKWGLEILHIHVHSVNILKAAEPMDALGILMNALKATTGTSTEHTAAIFPFLAGQSEVTKESESNNVEKLDCETKISIPEDESQTKDMTAKFEIVGNTTKTIHCVFQNGHVSVLEEPVDVKPDVSVMMTENNMKDFLNGAMSPFEAYMSGKVVVMGDWTLLKPMEKILRKLLSF